MIDKDPIARNRLLNARNSNVTWMDDTWIYKEIQPFVEEANKKCNWNFNWEFSEKLQFTKYSVGQFYTWHQDSFQEKSYACWKNDVSKIISYCIFIQS
jgi:hypothetical protein